MTNYVAISRDIWNDPDFPDEPMSQREAFMWLVAEAAWKPRKVRRANAVIALDRGELAHSIRFMAEAWGWHRARVERFLKALKNRDSIETRTETGVTVVRLCKYEKYQRVEEAAETAVKKDRDSTETNENQDNQDNKKNNPSDYQKAVAIWNEVCVPVGMAPIKAMPDKRRGLINARLDEHGIDGWRAACQAAASSPWWRGEREPAPGRQRFRGTIDALARPSNFAKLVEGFYETEPARAGKPDDAYEEFKRLGVAI